MANLWQQGIQESKSSWQNSSTADKAGKIGQGVGALSSIVSSSISLAKGNKAALDEVKNEAKGVNQQKVDSGSLDTIYNTAKNYEALNTHHDWQEFFANGGYLNSPDYYPEYYAGYPYDYYSYLESPYSYGAGGKIASAGLSNTANGAMAGMKIGGPWGAVIGGAVGLVGTAVGSVFGHSKAKKMAREANEAAEEANNGMTFKINSAIDDNAHNTLQSYENAMPYAFGGLLGDMGAVNYGLASDYLTIKDKQASNKQTPLSYLGNSYIKEKPVTVFDDSNSFANGGGITIKKSHEGLFTKQAKEEGMSVQEFANHVLANKDKYSSSTIRRATFARNASNWDKDGRKSTRYALGGDMQTNGSDFTDGLTEVNAGGTHEENPNGGVPMGVAPDNNPNLVEEGETIYNDYVYSNRIKPDKEALKKFHIYSSSGNMTYADLSKRLEKEAKERPNDPISKDGLNAQLAKLAQEQERQKAEEEEKRAKAAFEALSPQEKEMFLQEVARQQEAQAMQEQQAQQQAAQQEGQEIQEGQVSPEEAQMQEQQMSPEQQEALQQQMEQQQALEQQQAMDANAGNVNEGYAEGGELHKFDNGGKKHVGTWKKGWDEKKAWESYARPALERILNDAEARLKGVSNPIERRRIQEDIVNKFNSIQRSYADSYQSPEGAYTYSDKVKQHQLNWGQIGGNNAYYPGEGFGIADRINLPQGANTKDKYDTWNDGYWGPITSTRNLGSTLYGNDKFYAPYIKEFNKLGIRFGANKDYSYNNGSNQLYTLSLSEDPSVLKPVNPKTPEKINVPNITVPNQAVPTGNNNSKQLPTWPRYVGLFGPAVGLGMQAMGIGRNPGKKAYDAALSAISSTGNPSPTHIGDLVRYTPFDLWQAQNKADATRLATDRAIMNNSGPIGAKISGLVANANNYYQGNGTLMRQAQEYNNKNMMDVANFNRGTHQFNASADNQFALTANQNKQWRAQALMNYAAQKAAQDQQWYDSLYGNVNNLLKGISDYGRENAAINQINGLDWSQVWGKHRQNIGGIEQTSGNVSAKGGKITKKKRRGYTF